MDGRFILFHVFFIISVLKLIKELLFIIYNPMLSKKAIDVSYMAYHFKVKYRVQIVINFMFWSLSGKYQI